MSNYGARLRLLVIEPDADLRQALMRRFGRHGFVEVVGESRSFGTAMPRVAGLQPDWVVAGLGRDPVGGLAFLRELAATHASCRVAVIMPAGVSTSQPDLLRHVRALAKVVVRLADGLGVADAVDRLSGEVLSQILRAGGDSTGGASPAVAAGSPVQAAVLAKPAAQQSAGCTPSGAARPHPAEVATPPRAPLPTEQSGPRSVARSVRAGRHPAVVGIGVSTGGPTALAALLPGLPADFPLPVLIVQHMPPQFTKGLAESLSRSCRLPVAEAQGGEVVRAGRILIAPGGRHLRVVRRAGEVVTDLTDDAPECSCRPSVDYLFRSLVDVYGGHVLGVMLTGMGEDGWIGSRSIASAGGTVLAQDEASCTVYGMPRGPIQEGLAEAVPLDRLAGRITISVGGVPCS